MPNEKFAVDTHLFRELGELLVGRNSTALVELIKNAYDADATEVVIDGRDLDDPKRGRITISDDGIGMNPDQFHRGFLTIASRMKDTTQRKSAKFQRRYTGAKGIGRLAAHKLAKFIEIESCPDPNYVSPSDESLWASIDWDVIESKFLFDEIQDSGAVVVDPKPRPRKARSGTTITLKRLRRKWTSEDLVQFQSEIEGFRPPQMLIDLPKGLFVGKPLFHRPVIAEAGGSDPGIDFQLSGKFDSGEGFWPQIAESAEWLVEIDAARRGEPILVNLLPTKQYQAQCPDAKADRFELPARNDLPLFQARAFIRPGQAERAFQQWLRKSFGIRVYLEGFRVLPYGEPKDDWLSIDADYRMRPKSLAFLRGFGFDPPDDDPTEGLSFLGNQAYFGAVFLTSSGLQTTSGTPMLNMLVNREGFVPNAAYSHLQEVLRTALYLSVRVRAASSKGDREKKRSAGADRPESRLNLKETVESTVSHAAGLAREARQLAAQGEYSEAASRIEQAAAAFHRGTEASERLMTEGSVLRVLASVGTQMTAFVHEINSILGMAKALETAVSEIERELSMSPTQRKRLVQLRSAIEDLRRGIERQASYLTDVISPDARRRRSRQKLADRLEAGLRLVSAAAGRRGIEVENEIPPELKSPPMFPAELTVVFSNLLTNAVKAAGEDGRIRATGRQDREGQVTITVENTGTPVDLDEAERWFRPFESTTVETDPVLGQGMGMGLPITRNMLEEYGASIHFCPPSRGFATALEIVFPK